jgi:arginine/ornithine N-succinyltransferase beta subunit
MAVVVDVTEQADSSSHYILTNTSLDFRATLGSFSQDPEGGGCISKKVSSALNVKEGDNIRFATLRPR